MMMMMTVVHDVAEGIKSCNNIMREEGEESKEVQLPFGIHLLMPPQVLMWI